jgi:AcrR family transcriptional regulator
MLLTREDWIAEARKSFVSSGVDDVKVDVLAKRMKVTRGSFYWHFESREDLLNALLKDWEENNRREIAAIQAFEAREGAGLIELFRIWLGEDPSFPAFDIAIRIWARKSEAVSKVAHQIDEAWIGVLQSFLERDGMKSPESFVRARIMYFHQVGYFALSIKESLEGRVELAPYYYSALTGSPAPKRLKDALLEVGQRTAAAKAARARAARRADTGRKTKSTKTAA